MNFSGQNIIVMDLETLHSADDCRYCGAAEASHRSNHVYDCRGYEAIGWRDFCALDLSVGAYYDYKDGVVHWFDRETLEEMVALLVDRQPLMISYNGIGFDFALVGALLWREAVQHREGSGQTYERAARAARLEDLCLSLNLLASQSYDILAEIWTADPKRKFERGLNSLDAILAANGLPPKTGHGAQAPRDWQDGQYARVMNYCQNDVLLTKRLFEHICTVRGVILRMYGGLPIRYVMLDAVEDDYQPLIVEALPLDGDDAR